MPESKHKIFIIGAGGIVNDAHLPAYKIAGFTVAGIYDLDKEKATATAAAFSIPEVYNSIAEMIAAAGQDAIFDVAVPGKYLAAILTQLPDGCRVLLQKPMGDDLEEAKEILAITREKKQVAAVNFQLRYAPYITTARNMIVKGSIGAICSVEIYVNVFTPWHLWNFLFALPRVEILYHSIHYIDLIRSFLGNPKSVFAKTVKHPAMAELASVKSSIIMDYGEWISANIITNHCHNFGEQNQDAYIKIEGTKGAIKMKLGLLINYPEGINDQFEYVIKTKGEEPVWQMLNVEGRWFPHAFIGSIQQLMQTDKTPDNSVEDCIFTMACVEAAYQADQLGGIEFAASY